MLNTTQKFLTVNGLLKNSQITIAVTQPKI